jgi:hypothetical protein
VIHTNKNKNTQKEKELIKEKNTSSDRRDEK